MGKSDSFANDLKTFNVSKDYNLACVWYDTIVCDFA